MVEQFLNTGAVDVSDYSPCGRIAGITVSAATFWDTPTAEVNPLRDNLNTLE